MPNMPNASKQFENNLIRLLEKIGRLQQKFSLENKVRFFPAPLPAREEDKIFLPGTYLININRKDLKNLKNLINGWKKIALSGTSEYKKVMKKYAGDMEFAYNFLMLNYKPFIFPGPRGVIRIGYRRDIKIKMEEEEIRRINERFTNCFKNEIENKEKEIKERVKKLNQPMTDEEVRKFKEKELYGDRIKELKKEFRKQYSQNSADELYKIWGKNHEDEFFRIVKKSTKKS